MKTKVIICGEVKIGEKGGVHQADLAQAMGMERLTGWPKSIDDVQIVVGKLLANRKPALLHKAEKNCVPVVAVGDLINDDVRAKLIGILALKPKLQVFWIDALFALFTIALSASSSSFRKRAWFADRARYAEKRSTTREAAATRLLPK